MFTVLISASIPPKAGDFAFMADTSSNPPPQIAENPDQELAQLLERSIQLQNEALTLNKRVKELYEQIAQRSRNQRAD